MAVQKAGTIGICCCHTTVAVEPPVTPAPPATVPRIAVYLVGATLRKLLIAAVAAAAALAWVPEPIVEVILSLSYLGGVQIVLRTYGKLTNNRDICAGQHI